MALPTWDEILSLEEKTINWFSKRQALINKASSELRASANPPIQWSGKRQKRKNLNLQEVKLQQGEYVLKFGRKKLPYHVIFALACQSWFYPEEIRTSIQFLILEERKRWNFTNEELDLVLTHKAQCILYLQEQVHMKGWSWYFGAILTNKWTHINKNGQQVTYKLEEILPRYFYQQKKKPIPNQRIRGYRDHGSLGSLDKRVRQEEYRKDWSSKSSEEEYQTRKKQSRGFLSFLKGWFS